MDNGRNHVDRTMLGSGEAAEPGAAVVGAPRRRRGALGRDQRPALRDRVQPAGLGPRARRSSSPTTPATPSFAPGGWSGDELEPLWRRDGLAHAGHLIVYPDTPRAGRRRLARRRGAAAPGGPPRCTRGPRPALGLLAAARGAPRCRPAATSSSSSTSTPARRRRASRSPRPSQGFLFPAPGFGRDVYYQSLTTIARVVVV